MTRIRFGYGTVVDVLTYIPSLNERRLSEKHRVRAQICLPLPLRKGSRKDRLREDVAFLYAEMLTIGEIAKHLDVSICTVRDIVNEDLNESATMQMLQAAWETKSLQPQISRLKSNQRKK